MSHSKKLHIQYLSHSKGTALTNIVTQKELHLSQYYTIILGIICQHYLFIIDNIISRVYMYNIKYDVKLLKYNNYWKFQI